MTRHKNDRAVGAAEQRGTGRGLGNGVMREYTHESASLCLVPLSLALCVKMLQLLMGLLVVEIIVAASSGTTPSPFPSPCRAAKREM